MDEPADVTSKNRTRTHVLDQGSTTRNRKVVGSNPTSGPQASSSAPCPVAELFALPWMPSGQRHPAVWS
jgi:hypothetical protein